MNLYVNNLYREDVRLIAESDLPWDKLKGRSILLSGATGLLGSFLADVILRKNETDGLNCKIYALTRNEREFRNRFLQYADQPLLKHILQDVSKTFELDGFGDVDFVIHFASNTHPVQYATDPVGTITANIIGLKSMLDFAAEHHALRFAFASSNEIYGENRGDTEFFDEDYCGYINSNTLRAGYTESKRCGEALCQAYKVQNGLDVVIPRFTRSYGPTMLMSDSKAISQFIKRAVMDEDIVLKSLGTQYYSYQYMADSISGFLTVLLCGSNGEAYNIAERHSDIRLKDLAEMIAEIRGNRVRYEIPDALEASGYSAATKARLDGSKLASLGWTPKYDIRSGVERTVSILLEMKEQGGLEF